MSSPGTRIVRAQGILPAYVAEWRRAERERKRAMHEAGCRVVCTATGWIAVSPAFLKLLRAKEK